MEYLEGSDLAALLRKRRLLEVSEAVDCMFEVWELGSDGRYVHALAAEKGRVDAVPGYEGLIVDLDALWAEVDSLPDDGIFAK